MFIFELYLWSNKTPPSYQILNSCFLCSTRRWKVITSISLMRFHFLTRMFPRRIYRRSSVGKVLTGYPIFLSHWTNILQYGVGHAGHILLLQFWQTASPLQQLRHKSVPELTLTLIYLFNSSWIVVRSWLARVMVEILLVCLISSKIT